MSRTVLERKLSSATRRLKELREELVVVEEQLASLSDEADDTRLRALVSETPLAGREHQEAQRHVDVVARHHREVIMRIETLERAQDDLLDRLVAEVR